MGLLCIVTNCSEGMDYAIIGEILSGLVQCGIWGCFDEFNRIELLMLGVISTQLQTIRNALMSQSKKFMVSLLNYFTIVHFLKETVNSFAIEKSN